VTADELSKQAREKARRRAHVLAAIETADRTAGEADVTHVGLPRHFVETLNARAAAIGMKRGTRRMVYALLGLALAELDDLGIGRHA